LLLARVLELKVRAAGLLDVVVRMDLF